MCFYICTVLTIGIFFVLHFLCLIDVVRHIEYMRLLIYIA